ncbi:hypothetical protein [Sphingomonas sp. R86521]|uniref:hypothetical protein n=1 Tax=Sphingomonas sp. R86521 TaxID=3093860 RepID=UPI0036D42786
MEYIFACRPRDRSAFRPFVRRPGGYHIAVSAETTGQRRQFAIGVQPQDEAESDMFAALDDAETDWLCI